MENVKEFWDSLKERIVNPFLFTYVVVWLGRNWSLIYYVCSENPYKLQERQGYITDYLSKKDFLAEFNWNFWITLVIILGFFLFRLITKSITLFYKSVVENKVVNFFELKEIPTRETLKREQKHVRKLQQEVEQTRSLLTSYIEARTKAEEAAATSASDMEKLRMESIEYTNLLQKFPMLQTYVELVNKNLNEEFYNEMVTNYKNGRKMKETIREFLTPRILLNPSDNKLTPRGEELVKLYDAFNPNKSIGALPTITP